MLMDYLSLKMELEEDLELKNSLLESLKCEVPRCCINQPTLPKDFFAKRKKTEDDTNIENVESGCSDGAVK
jgi:hypothetical protein